MIRQLLVGTLALAVAVAVAGVGLASCVGDNPDVEAPPDSGAPDAGDDRGAPDAGGDAPRQTFCTAHADATLCEDFEGPFPPANWVVRRDKGGDAVLAAGYLSERALEARLPAQPETAFAGLQAVLLFESGKTKLVLSARLRVVVHDPPVGATPILTLVLGPDYTFAIASAGPGTVYAAADPSRFDAGGKEAFAANWNLDEWHEFEATFERLDAGAAAKVRVSFDGVPRGERSLPPIDTTAKGLLVGPWVFAPYTGRCVVQADEILVRVE